MFRFFAGRRRAVRTGSALNIVMFRLLPAGARPPSHMEGIAITRVLMQIFRRRDPALIERRLTNLAPVIRENDWTFMVTSTMYFTVGLVPPDQQQPFRDGCDDVCRRLFDVDFWEHGCVGGLLIGGLCNGRLSARNYSFLSTALYGDDLPRVERRMADKWLAGITAVVTPERPTDAGWTN
jgi:hypothetical protein